VIATPSRPLPPVRQLLTEQLVPLSSFREAERRRWVVAVDARGARARLRGGQVAYDPMEALGAGDAALGVIQRAVRALERAMLVPAKGGSEPMSAPDLPVADAVAAFRSWLVGEPVSPHNAAHAIRRAAALAGNVILGRTSQEVLSGGEPLAHWSNDRCPCCGGPADFAITAEDFLPGGGTRTLICSRCDTRWPTSRLGCLTCGAVEPPSIARVSSYALGLQLVMCNSCGRYIKEPLDGAIADPWAERLLGSQLDAAAERRGLRL
jgi:hypothetical protein